MITQLGPGQIFVFGSNLAGIHGAGAAAQAHEQFGAEWNVGEGPTGQCYAIPTKDYNIKTRPLSLVQKSVAQFLLYAKNNPQLTFLVTAIGCGLAGYNASQIAPFFENHTNNVILPVEFLQ